MYSARNADGALNFYDPAVGAGGMTLQYIADRAKFLGWKNIAGTQNTPQLGEQLGLGNCEFKDLTQNLKITIGANDPIPGDPGIPETTVIVRNRITFGDDNANTLTGGDISDDLYGGGADTIDGGKGDDYLEGNAGADKLTGGEGSDSLLGGADDDTLEGGTDNDWLEGGKGNDTYTFKKYSDGKTNDGKDWIYDADGLGQIKDGETVLSGGKKDGNTDNTWRSEDGQYLYSLYTRTEGNATYRYLAILRPDGGTIWVKNWQEGELGIKLSVPDVPTQTVTPDRTVVGDRAPIDFDPATPGCQTRTDELGNVITDPEQAEDGRNDVFFDGSGNDRLQGKAGNDALDAANDSCWGQAA